MLICWRGDETPVPGAAGVRANSIWPTSLVKLSSGSFWSNGIGVCSAGVSSRRPMSWSMNWPHAQPHCEIPFSEKRFWPLSLKIRLLIALGDGPACMAAIPSA